MNLSPSSPQLRLAYALGLFGVIAFGATLPVTRFALDAFSPGFLTFARAIIAIAFAILTLAILRKPVRDGNEVMSFVAGVLLIFCFPGFMAVAMKTVPASHGGVVLGFLPLATAVIARLMTDEKPSPAFWALSVIGALVVVGFTALKTDELGQSGISSGDWWLVAAGISASTGYVIFGKLSRSTPGWEIISRSLILNAPLVLIGVWWFYEPRFLNADTASIVALIYLGSFSMFLAFCAWNVALAIGGIARIGQMQLLQTFVTLAVAALLLGEHIDLITVITAIAITAIIFLSKKL